MSQVLADDVMSHAPRRTSSRLASADYPVASPVQTHWAELASEDELDWMENQARPAHEAKRLDAALIAIAVILTAVAVAVTMGILKRL